MNPNLNLQPAAWLLAAAFSAMLCAPQPLLGIGVALPDQDAFATARGNAFVATADDPAAVYYNPAGISQLVGIDLSVGAYGIAYWSTYKGAAGSIDSQTQLEALPQIFATYSLPQYRLTLGLGAYSPYGLRMEWPMNVPFLAAGETGEVDYYTLNPVLAWQIYPSLSIAAGPTLNYSQTDLKEYPGFVNHFRGRDMDVGYNVGLMWHPAEEHSVGLTYRSATDMNYSGHATVPPTPLNTSATANFHFPQTIAFGYSYRPTENWNFEADADWTDWSTLQTVTVNPLKENLPFNWDHSWMWDFGATRYLGDGWRVSAGYMYSMNSVPSYSFNPLIPDSDRQIFSLGVGKKYRHFSWDAAYQLAWGPSRSISGDAFPPANGSYEFFSHAFSVNLGYHF